MPFLFYFFTPRCLFALPLSGYLRNFALDVFPCTQPVLCAEEGRCLSENGYKEAMVSLCTPILSLLVTASPRLTSAINKLKALKQVLIMKRGIGLPNHCEFELLPC